MHNQFKEISFTSRIVSLKNSFIFVFIVGAKRVLLVNTSAVGAKVLQSVMMTLPSVQIKQVSCPTKESVLLFFQYLFGFFHPRYFHNLACPVCAIYGHSLLTPTWSFHQSIVLFIRITLFGHFISNFVISQERKKQHEK